MNCRDCGEELLPYGQSLERVFDVGCEYIGITCKKCATEKTKRLKKERFVQEYEGENIYYKEGLYYPYWSASYGYKTLGGAWERIDNKHIAVVDMRLLLYGL